MYATTRQITAEVDGWALGVEGGSAVSGRGLGAVTAGAGWRDSRDAGFDETGAAGVLTAGALTAGVTVSWREYGLKLPPHYPLRFLDDIEGSDLLGPFAAAMAPRGTLRTEAQIVVRPATSWVLNWGWRGHATALLLKLQAKKP